MKAWTHPNSRIMWLRDLLPRELPEVRIMTFGYAANFLDPKARPDIRSIANKLLSELVDVRSTEEVRFSLAGMKHHSRMFRKLTGHCSLYAIA